MRKLHIVLAIVGGALIGLSGYYQGPAVQAAEKAKTAPVDANGNNPVGTGTPVARRQKQVQTPFYCFGDAACEREMARQGRPVADSGKKSRDENEGPYIQGIPGQTDVPGFSDTPVPVVPGK
jgi:hypothetical protein